MYSNCEYTEQAVADSRRGVVLQLKDLGGDKNFSLYKCSMFRNVPQCLGFRVDVKAVTNPRAAQPVDHRLLKKTPLYGAS